MEKAIVSLIGERRPNDVVAVFATPNAGKTLMMLKHSADTIASGRRVLYLDTEGGASEMRERWSIIEPGLLDEKFELMEKRSIYSVMELFARPLVIDISKGGKATAYHQKPDGRKKNTDYDHMVDVLKDDGMIVIDSMTSPVRQEIPTSQQCFPARASVYSMWFGAIFRMMDIAGKGEVWITHHASYNPADTYQTNRGSIQGGSAVTYYSKKIIGVEVPGRRKLRDSGVRKLWAIRSPYHQSEGATEWIRISEDRMVSGITEEEVVMLMKGEK